MRSLPRTSLILSSVTLMILFATGPSRSSDIETSTARVDAFELVEALALLPDRGPTEASEALEALLAKARAERDTRSEAIIVWGLSTTRIAQGRHREAQELAASSRKLFEELGQDRWAGEAENCESAATQLQADPALDATLIRVHFLERLGSMEMNLLRLGDALRHFDTALGLVDEDELPLYEASLLAYRGSVLSLLQQPEAAEEDMKRFEQLAGKQAPELASVVSVATDLVLGTGAWNFEDLIETLETVGEEYGDRLPPDYFENLEFISMLQEGRTAEAAEQCRRLMESWGATLSAPPTVDVDQAMALNCEVVDFLANVSDSGPSQESLVGLASALEQSLATQPEISREALGLLVSQFSQMAQNKDSPENWPSGESVQLSIDSLQALLSAAAPVGLRSGPDSALSPLIHLLATAELKTGNIEAAFEHAEQARARELLDRLVDPPAERSEDTTQAATIAELRNRELKLEEQLLGASWSNQPESGELNESLDEVRRELDATSHRAAVSRPHSDRVQPLSLNEIQSTLGDDTTLVSFLTSSSTNPETLAWVITRHGIELVQLPVRLDELRREVRLFDETLRALENPATQAQALYQELWEPIRGFIETRNVLLVPHGPLQELPFAALRDPSTGRWLGQQWTLSYAPSASVYAWLAERPSDGGTDVLVLGDPTGELPASAREAHAVAELWHADALLGADASEAALRARGANASVIHIAAHGVIDRESPLFSRLELAPSPEDSSDPRHDGRLELHEIVDDLDLRDTEVVVLPACDTAAGPRTAGDEVTSLARAFLLAGARSTVTTLWAIPDEQTALLMVDFHRYLAAGDDAAEALRRAQESAIASTDRSHPWYWAAFTVQGAPGKLHRLP